MSQPQTIGVTIYRQDVLIYIEWTGAEFMVHVVLPTDESEEPQSSMEGSIVHTIRMEMNELFDSICYDGSNLPFDSVAELTVVLGNSTLRRAVVEFLQVFFYTLLKPNVIWKLAQSVPEHLRNVDPDEDPSAASD